MTITACNDISHFQQLVKSEALTVIDFTATWCGPCRIMAPKVNELAAIYGGVNFVKIDVDEAQDIASHAKVSAMPTFKFYKAGTLLDTVIGADVGKLKAALKLYAA